MTAWRESARIPGHRPCKRMSVALTTTESLTRWPSWWAPVSSTSDDLFRVLADPTRRHILDLLAERGSLTVSELANEFPDLVASGISKHLMVLREVGLVAATRQGRQRIYRINGEAMADALAPWIAKYEPYWAGALDQLRRLAEEEEPPE